MCTKFFVLRYTLIPYLGVAQGFAKVGSQSELGLRYLLAGFVVILIRGVITERIVAILSSRDKKKAVNA